MVLFDLTKIKRVWDSFMVRVPMRLFHDSAFPFRSEVEDESSLVIEIVGETLVVRREGRKDVAKKKSRGKSC